MEGVKLDCNSHLHKIKIDAEDPENYRFYAFYRDPVERYLSALNYIKRLSDPMMTMLHYFYGVKISCAKILTRETLSDEQRQMINDVSPGEYLTHFVKRSCGGLPFSQQTPWLDKPNMTLLDYRDFDNQARFVCSLFDVTVGQVPRLNVGLPIHHVSDLSDSEIAQIKEFYKTDYDFLANKGIYF
jgi:hypothetical protein